MSELMGLVGDAVVCGRCSLLRAEVPGRFHQCCRCETPTSREPIRGYDFAMAAELCRCCGAQLVASGSKYSVWFCQPCLQLVRGFNDQLGCYIIPIGRHSLHGRIALAGSAVENGRMVAEFVDRVGSWSERLGWIDAWSGSAVRYNRATLEMGIGDVLLSTYLAAVGTSVTKELCNAEAFGRMVAAL
jgi:hypothetical protein